MSYKNEFGVVDLIIQSEFKTKAVDAFTLSLIKVERQIRRIFTYLIYQHPNYAVNDILDLRKTLSDNSKMYFENFIVGIDRIYTNPVKQIYGDGYDSDFDKLKLIITHRNKIFHGQVTNESLSRAQLIKMVGEMKNWSETIALNFNTEIGYDGFKRNSYRKSKTTITLNNIEEFSTIEKYKGLLKTIGR